MARVSVFSYNVLSSHLCDSSAHTGSAREDLDPQTRFERIVERIKRDVFPSNGVLCLQEVSRPWEGLFQQIFEEHDYHFVNSAYGTEWSGYMGVGIAYPRGQYRLEKCTIDRISDTYKYQAPREERQDSTGGGLLALLWSYTGGWFFRGAKPARPPLTPWKDAQRRWNTTVALTLRGKTGEEVFTVVTYHMPCAFRVPQVMVIHAALALQHAQRVANGMPLIVAGDWNFQPDSSMYSLVTTGSIDSSDSAFPELRVGDDWRPDVEQPMRSAYFVANGEEPEITNYAEFKKERFSGTLDYVFISDQFDVESTLPVPSLEDCDGPFPSPSEPSDHVMIGAQLLLRS